MPKKTVISHFYNESYLLPWWLNYHKNIFDNGILINYASNDHSVDIIKHICPHWTIVDSKNKEFCARNADSEVMAYEFYVKEWKMALNITEFIVGDIDKNIINNQQLLIPQISFFDWDPNNKLDNNSYLWQQKTYGIDYKTDFTLRYARSLHCANIRYPSPGRHFLKYNTENLLIFHYANCISSQEMLSRRLQIQHRIPIKDKKLDLGFQHHNHGKGLTEQDVYNTYMYYKNINFIKDQSYYINRL